MAKTPFTHLALILALAAPLSAQTTEAPPAENPPPAEPAPGEAPAEPATTEDGLSMGTSADGIGQSYVSATFESWEQRCIRTETKADPCVLYTLLKNEQGDSVAEFSVFGLPKGSKGPAVAGANFIAPLETLLTAGMSLQVDSQAPKTYPFSVCTPAGCIARLGFTEDEVNAMKKGAKVTFVLVPFTAPDAKVTVVASLKGFTAGMEAVNTANDAADAAAAEAAAAAGDTAPAAGAEGGQTAPTP